MLKTPILFMVFNRPDTTRKVFAEIRRQKPQHLFIAADGPRDNVHTDADNCSQVHAIVNDIDWECHVETCFQTQNLGCRTHCSQAINWFFSQVEEGIILEDDCLPHPSFFPYCEELLNYYRHDTRIMHIAGANMQDGIRRGNGSYYFSQRPHIWGWASWRRAWKYYDVEMSSYPEIVENKPVHLYHDALVEGFYRKIYHILFRCHYNTWDTQWDYAVATQHGLAVIPNVNLISNIGFNESATHDATSPFSNIPLKEMSLPLIHPSKIFPDVEAEKYIIKKEYKPEFIGKTMLRKIYHWIKD